MKNTTNYGLKKPDGTDAVDIAIINQNMDTIDARMKSNATQIDDLKNNKANTSHGNHVPATQSANNKKFLRCDNTWQDVTPGNIGAAPASHTHDDRYYTETEINTKLDAKANTSHTHTKSQITDFPTSLPANGGNADTVDGKHAIDFPLKSQGIGGNAPVWAGSNLNDIPIGTYTTLSTGVPVTGEYFLVTTRYNDTGKIKEQYALRQANGERYFRWFNGTAWSSWRNLDDYAPSYKSANGYWGICPVKGNDTGWIRTPSLGLLPYASGGGASAGSLGTSSWKFKEIHGVDIFANGVNVGTEINNLKSIVNNPKVVKSVQRGLLNSSVKGSKENGIYYQDVVIASVVMTKALVLVTSTDAKSANARLVNATTLRIYSGAQYGGDSFDATNCNWQVIEFY
ncbi:MAG: pyocin knob domain-containing protein [Clostridiales bacterium]|nr:pyocin knob domain-containing protein [Clostridiales bacterium]